MCSIRSTGLTFDHAPFAAGKGRMTAVPCADVREIELARGSQHEKGGSDAFRWMMTTAL